MSTTHTPAPWSHDDGHVFTNEKGREYNSIATVHDIYTNDGKVESNAQLIASAPELLEALKYANLLLTNQEEAEVRFDLTPEQVKNDVLNKIKSAIQKAEGSNVTAPPHVVPPSIEDYAEESERRTFSAMQEGRED